MNSYPDDDDWFDDDDDDLNNDGDDGFGDDEDDGGPKKVGPSSDVTIDWARTFDKPKIGRDGPSSNRAET